VSGSSEISLTSRKLLVLHPSSKGGAKVEQGAARCIPACRYHHTPFRVWVERWSTQRGGWWSRLGVEQLEREETDNGQG
jgi:hypothetical protein